MNIKLASALSTAALAAFLLTGCSSLSTDEPPSREATHVGPAFGTVATDDSILQEITISVNKEEATIISSWLQEALLDEDLGKEEAADYVNKIQDAFEEISKR